jgi:tetratricopeptide (TPR) repeat protein
MSLLLEALKKAELAKQGRKPADGEPAELAIAAEPEPSRPSADARPAAQTVITREELPDISQPLEILSEDLPSSAPRRTMETLAVEPAAEAPPSEPERAAAGAPRELQVVVEPTPAAPGPDASAERDAARQLFEAKEVEYNPRRNFYITIGVLLAAGAGYGGYVWWQLQPHSAYNTAAVQNAPKAAPAPAAQVSGTAAPTPEPQAPSATPVQVPTATMPEAAALANAAPSPARPPPGAAAETETAAPKGPVFARSDAGPAKSAAAGRSPGVREPAGAQARAEQSPIAITPPALAVDPLIGRAFDAYTRGDLAGAREAYQQALQRDPLNRDALLGLAAIDVRSRSFDTAGARYTRLLELDPRDIDAMAGLIGLRGQIDPGQTESRLKTLIATSPDAAPLHFALGNLFAQQSRWAEAQAAYFKAYAGDPENADFAFNLAVSLDQLRQKAPALQYYQRAAALAADHPRSFDPALADARIQELRRQ